MNEFDHEQLDVDVALNIAEGAEEFSIKDKARFYRIAKRSATESVAILHVCERLTRVDPARDLVPRITDTGHEPAVSAAAFVAMLVQMVSGESRARARARSRNEGMLQASIPWREATRIERPLRRRGLPGKRPGVEEPTIRVIYGWCMPPAPRRRRADPA
jgi:hypothetical protein